MVDNGCGILGTNMYTYCLNNPVNMYDDDGRWPQWLVKRLVGSKWNSLKEAEKQLVCKYPYEAAQANSAATTALNTTARLFPKDWSDGTRANAFQHAFWNALMAYEIGSKKAELFATAHESYSTAQLNSKGIGGFTVRQLCDMDLYNNSIGRQIGAACPHDGRAIYGALLARFGSQSAINAAAKRYGVPISYALLLADQVMEALNRGKLKYLR